MEKTCGNFRLEKRAKISCRKNCRMSLKWPFDVQMYRATMPCRSDCCHSSIKQDAWDLLGLHLNQKDLKSVKKHLSYSQLINGRLRDSSEYHAGYVLSIRASFESKRSEIRQEMAKYSQFTNGRLRDFNEYHAGCIESVRASFEPKRSKMQEMAVLWPIYQWEVA